MEQGARGEICLRARLIPHYPLGYWQNESATEETFGGEWSTRRTPPSRTRTATTGTSDAPTT